MPGDAPDGKDQGSDVATRPVSAQGDRPQSALVDRRYRLLALLGEGGVGRVHRALDLELGEHVALKLLHDVTPLSAQMLRREVRLARRVTHENVVRVHDIGLSEDGSTYLTMELVEGPSLRELLRKGAPPPEEAASIAAQICRGLGAAHRAGVVHADLKPGNVLLRDADGARTALLTDFGISRALAETQSDPFTAGTPQYMAPEQRRLGAIDARADVYALGLLLFELFTGERLARSPDEPHAVLAARIRASLPDALADVLVRAIAPDPAARPASVDLLAGAIPGPRARSVAAPRAPEPAATRLAVAPLRVVGPDGEGYLGVGIAEELTRVLSTLPGLTVLGAAAVAGDDPRTAADRLSADALVEGTVQRVGGRVRVNVALVQVPSGVSLFSERLDGAMDDVFAFQEEIALRICEALRVRWIGVASVRRAKPEAIDLYFRARTQLVRGIFAGPSGAVGLAEQCLALAPELEPALALHAIACSKAWFLPSAYDERDWREASIASVARARELAPTLSDTHLAAALVAVQLGDGHAGVAEFRRALELAPTNAAAHDHFGRMLAEAGRIDDAFVHLDMARRLDPFAEAPALYRARWRALRGDASHVRELFEARERPSFPTAQLASRVAAWVGDVDLLERVVAYTRGPSKSRLETWLLETYCRYVRGEIDPSEVDRLCAEHIPERLSPRGRSNIDQHMVEGHCLRGAPDLALRRLEAAASTALVDLDWLGCCPALETIRAEPRFVAALEITGARAEPFLSG